MHSDEFRTLLQDAHINYWKQVARQKREIGELPKVGTGLTCLASGKGGGIRMISDTFEKVYELVAAEYKAQVSIKYIYFDCKKCMQTCYDGGK